jgi:WD40 repeat protein
MLLAASSTPSSGVRSRSSSELIFLPQSISYEEQWRQLKSVDAVPGADQGGAGGSVRVGWERLPGQGNARPDDRIFIFYNPFAPLFPGETRLAMTAAATSFYVTGGTLRPDAPSYVERQADRDLYLGLSRGEFCYVLHARQMGKSSLMARTAARLREEGVAVVVLDLTAIGQNVSVEQWYDGLLVQLGEALDLEDELDDFWRERSRLGPLQRWMAALRDVVLARVPGRVVLFIDEIDVVQSLPFSTDEFFAGIRECYNRRAEDPAFERLTFCLLGVASPPDLIRDTRLTPFNIGRRIELTDFTEAEAAPLAMGLLTPPPCPLPETERGSSLGACGDTPLSASGRGAGGRGQPDALLRRILHWTGGHPYLTQRVCQAVAAWSSAPSTEHREPGTAVVDRLCDELFLSSRARERDNNLLFVRESLLRGRVGDLSVGEVRFRLLECYARIRSGRRVVDDEASPLVEALRLSGIVRPVEGVLQVRNRIYGHVFDLAWARANMPDAELQRQRAAYRRGLGRAAAVSAVVLTVVAGLALTASRHARRADAQRRLAEARGEEVRRTLYGSQMKLAQQSIQEGDLRRAGEVLEGLRPGAGEEDLRGFEWRYLRTICQGRQRYTIPHPASVDSVAFSPDGRLLATAGEDHMVRLWDVATKRRVASLAGHTDIVRQVAFSRDGRLLVSGSWDRSVRLWDVATRRPIAALKGHKYRIHAVAFSPDGKTVASGCNDVRDRTVRLWDVASRRQIALLPGFDGSLHSIAFSPGGKLLATGDNEGPILLRELPTRRVIAILKGHTEPVFVVQFSPDGRLLASGSSDGTAKLWDVAGRREIATLGGFPEIVGGLAFSPDGRLLATGAGGTLQVWDAATRRALTTLLGHADPIREIAFSPDGRTLATAGRDQTARLWAPRGEQSDTFELRPATPVGAVIYSPDGRTVAVGGEDGSVQTLELGSRRRSRFPGEGSGVRQLAFSPDGRLLAAVDMARGLRLWDLADRRRRIPVPDVAGVVNEVAFSPDGRLLAIGCEDRSIRLWRVATSREEARIREFAGPVSSVEFSPDGRVLLSGSVARPADGSGATFLWEVGSWRRVGRLWGSPTSPNTVRISPDGKSVIESAGGGAAMLYDLGTRHITAFLGPRVRLGATAYSPDSRTLAAAEGDSIVLWNLVTRQAVATLTGHQDTVNAVAFSPDGNTLVSGSTDGTVRFWRAAPFQETDPLRVVVTTGSQSVRLDWQPLPRVLGYNVYLRFPQGKPFAGAADLQRLNDELVTGSHYTEETERLANGRAETYAVAPVYPAGTRRGIPSTPEREGTRVPVQAIPALLPPGWLASSVDEGLRSGSSAFDPATGELRLRCWGRDSTEGYYFLRQLVEGDFQMTVKVLEWRKERVPWHMTGAIVRESLDAQSRFTAVVPDGALGRSWRNTGTEASFQEGGLPGNTMKLPVTLRLTRRGSTIAAEYSKDDGKSFRAVSDPVEFVPALAKRVYVGLALVARGPERMSEARIRDLELRRR